jgi:hypothetical protein
MKNEFEKPSTTQLDKQYHIVITDGDEVVVDEVMKGLCLVGEAGNRLCEVVLNENIVGIAAMLHSGSKTRHAVRFATFVENMTKEDMAEQATDMEDMLSNILEGGLQ